MSNYHSLQKILHRQFLGENNLSSFLLKRLYSKSDTLNLLARSSHVFITGLARAGTTSLLNRLYATNEFGSLLYKYMPFILSPTLVEYYLKYFPVTSSELVERFHGDGILFGPNSPECLDEIFWIKSIENWYCKQKLAVVEDISETTINTYAYFLHRYASIQSKSRMVIKNNNNHLRIKSLANALPNSVFLFLVRDPLQHSVSLMNQHANFLKLQEKDNFILEYMNLVGHREFGANIAPFVYPNLEGRNHLQFSSKTLEYWISQWIATYSWILTIPLKDYPNINIISYDLLCKDPALYKRICNLLGVQNSSAGLNFRLGMSNAEPNKLTNNCKDLLSHANDIYHRLVSMAY